MNFVQRMLTAGSAGRGCRRGMWYSNAVLFGGHTALSSG